MADESPARITRVKLKNYKSIVSCDVELRPLTILVGPNGSGKSNFVDALRFVKQALVLGLDQAMRNRGNALHILSEARPAGSTWFSIQLDFSLPDGSGGRYAFQIDVRPDGDFRVIGEELIHHGVTDPFGPVLYSISEDGSSMWASDDIADKYPSYSGDRLFLGAYSGMTEARPVYDLLTSMVFYNPEPASLRVPRERDSGERLLSDGENVASVLRRIEETKPETLWRINQYLLRVLPSLESVASRDLGGYDSLEFRQLVANKDGVARFTPRQMSDGTLRALAILVALFQGRMGGKSTTSLVGIEEPEAGLHPALGAVLLNALEDASVTTQILATTHSADMLHMGVVDLDNVLAVSADDGVTAIGRIDAVSRSIVQDRLYTVGELLQMDQVRPEMSANGSGQPDSARQPTPERT